MKRILSVILERSIHKFLAKGAEIKMYTLTTRLLRGCGLAFCLMTSANAALVNYSESVDGDISSSPVFQLDMAGTHTWAGSFFANYAPLSVDPDPFVIVIPSGFQLTSVAHSISNVAFSGYDFIRENTVIANSTNTLLLFKEQEDVFNAGSLFSVSALPLGAGQYLITPTGIEFGCSVGPCSATWDWSVSMSVTSVPIPAAVWLFGSALGVMGVMRRKFTS